MARAPHELTQYGKRPRRQFHPRAGTAQTSLGFVEVARMPEIGAKFDKWQDLVLLQLRLDDRATPVG